MNTLNLDKKVQQNVDGYQNKNQILIHNNQICYSQNQDDQVLETNNVSQKEFDLLLSLGYQPEIQVQPDQEEPVEQRAWASIGSTSFYQYFACIVFQDKIYFTLDGAGGLDVYDPLTSSFSTLFINGPVTNFCVFNNELYIFGNIWGNPSKCVKYDGNTTQNVGTLSFNSIIYLEVYNNELYAIADAGGYGLYKLSGSDWVNVLPIINMNPKILKTFNNNLYIVGSSGTFPVGYYNGINITYVPGNINSPFISAEVYKNELYIGMYFEGVLNGVTSTSKLLKWNGSNAFNVPLTSTTINGILSLHSFNNNLYIGSVFITSNGVLKYNGTTDIQANPGDSFNSNVWDMTDYQNNLYAVGTFTTIGALSVKNAAVYQLI